MIDKKQELTPFAKLLSEKPRKCHEFDVSGFFGMAGEPLAKVAIRVATKREQDLAVVEAWQYALSTAGKELQDAARDRDILEEAKTAFVLSKVIRDPARPEKMPLFPTGSWMVEAMTVDQLAVLLNLYNTVKDREAPAPVQVTDEAVEALTTLAAAAAESDMPASLFAGYNREFLAQSMVLMALKLKEARAAGAKQEPASEN